MLDAKDEDGVVQISELCARLAVTHSVFFIRVVGPFNQWGALRYPLVSFCLSLWLNDFLNPMAVRKSCSPFVGGI